MSDRRALEKERKAVTRKLTILRGDEEPLDLYVTLGFYEDGTIGEIFLKAGKSGDLVRGLLDGLGISTSLALQYGVPLRAIVDKWVGMKFEPSGFTNGDQDHPMVASILDYLGKWLRDKFPDQCPELGGN